MAALTNSSGGSGTASSDIAVAVSSLAGGADAPAASGPVSAASGPVSGEPVGGSSVSEGVAVAEAPLSLMLSSLTGPAG
ncbi:hypothetical protein ACWV95_28810 [Streptomyces albus]